MALEVAFLVRFSSGFQFWNLLYKLHKIAVKKFRKSKIRRTLFSAEIFNFWKKIFFSFDLPKILHAYEDW